MVVLPTPEDVPPIMIAATGSGGDGEELGVLMMLMVIGIDEINTCCSVFE